MLKLVCSVVWAEVADRRLVVEVDELDEELVAVDRVVRTLVVAA